MDRRLDTMHENALVRLSGTCATCGYPNPEGESRCEKCGRRLDLPPSRPGNGSDKNAKSQLPGGNSPAAARRRGLPDEIRGHLSARVQDFRKRRVSGSLPLAFQTELPPEVKILPFQPIDTEPTPERERPVGAVRPRRTAPPPRQQPALDFFTPPARAEAPPLPRVAPFRLRLLGHGIDFGLTVASLLVFLLPLRFIAGTVVLDRFFLTGVLCAYCLLTLVYSAVFLASTRATPGMQRLGLRLVTFDGLPATRRQLLWRLLGAIVSACALLVGFLWAAADEGKLSWHDRISKTFLTADRE